jgi:hypothetical protein
MGERVPDKPGKKGSQGNRDPGSEKRATSPPEADANAKPAAATSSKARKYVPL